MSGILVSSGRRKSSSEFVEIFGNVPEGLQDCRVGETAHVRIAGAFERQRPGIRRIPRHRLSPSDGRHLVRAFLALAGGDAVLCANEGQGGFGRRRILPRANPAETASLRRSTSASKCALACNVARSAARTSPQHRAIASSTSASRATIGLVSAGFEGAGSFM
jgi:hypothetical protein